MPEWLDLAKKGLDPDDQLEKSFLANYERTGGYLVLSNSKLFFVAEKGFLHKTYSIVLELTYKRIKNIEVESGYRIVLTEVDDRRYRITLQVSAPTVEKALRDLITKLPEAKPTLS